MKKEELFLFSKICRGAAMLLMLLACAAAILPQNGEAARREAVHRLNYFQSYETEVDGRQALRIEVGMDRDNVTYDVTTRPYLEKQLIIDLSNTEPGKLKPDYTLLAKYAKHLHIRELEARHTQIRIDCKNPVVDGSYAVHAEPADRKAKKPYRLVIDIFATGGTASSSRVAGVSGHSVVIDPGHGGIDGGAGCAVSSTDFGQEKNINLSIATKVKALLEAEGAKVVMTRTSDKWVCYADRNAAVRKQDPDMFIAIHCDSSSTASAMGTSAYYYRAYSQPLAKALHQSIVAAYKSDIYADKPDSFKNKVSRGANFYAFRVTRVEECPAVLIEYGFVSNTDECQVLQNAKNRDTLAKATVEGIKKYISAS